MEEIRCRGKDNIRFAVPMNVRGTVASNLMVEDGGTKEVVCKIDESRYKVSDGYKVSLIPVDGGWYPEHYYIIDLASLIGRGIVKII